MLSVNELEDRLIDLAFAEDIGDGDHTTLCCMGIEMVPILVPKNSLHYIMLKSVYTNYSHSIN